MAHNFRAHLSPAATYFPLQPAFTTGAAGNSCFVSKSGLDTNDGLTPDTPKKTILSACGLARTYVFIGTGAYAEGRVSVANNATPQVYIGDGLVLVYAPTGNTVLTLNDAASSIAAQGYYDLNFRGFTAIAQNYSSNFNYCPMTRCNVSGITSIYSNYSQASTAWCLNLFDCQLTNWNVTIASSGGFTLTRCNLFNVKVNGGGIVTGLTYSYLDTTTALRYTGTAANCKNNNINGTLDTGTGPQSFAAIGSAYLLGSINADPRFNNTFAQDYTLKEDSPHLVSSIGPSNLSYSNSLYLNGPTGDITAGSGHFFTQVSTGVKVPIVAASNLTASLQNSQLRAKVKEAVGGTLTGTFDTAPIKVGDVTQQITYLDFAAGQNFDTDYPATEGLFDANNPQPLNNNVPDAANYTTGTAGRNPNRLSFLMRWSQKDAPDIAVDTDWITGATFLLFEPGQLALYNPVSVLGNANAGYLVASQTSAADAPRAPQAKFVQFRVVLTNGYFSK